MVLSVIVLDNEENFIQYLNPDRIQIKEVNTRYGLKTVEITYYVESLSDYKTLFRIGNKLWVSQDGVDDCLYVINTEVESDLFSENNVVFDAEEKLSELNYVFFSQTSISNENGDITINYDTLNTIFGGYYTIGIVQKCLSTRLNTLHPTGIMSLMELLRFIEEETGNVFKTRYEKDVNSNKIHCYLDFLNPKFTNKEWEFHLFYNEVDTTSENTPLIDSSDDVKEMEDIVSFPDVPSETVVNVEDVFLRLTHENTILLDENFINLGVTSENSPYELVLSYENGELNNNSVNIPNHTVLELYDSNNEEVLYKHILSPKLSNVHERVLDLGFNVENIVYNLDENDTYTAIAPIVTADNLTHKQLNTVITNWINLEVTKGDLVPMIVQKVTKTGASVDAIKNTLGTSNVENNYYSRPINPSDSGDSFEFYIATAYWRAPFTKIKGELSVVDDDITGVEYTHIHGNIDNIDEDSTISTPKTGSVETSDDDPYAIFNDVCMKLKDKRFPEVNIKVDVAELIDKSFNNFEIFDTVMVKIPTLTEFVTAIVDQTEKNLLDFTENTVELTSFSVDKKISQKQTEIESTPVTVTYPMSKQLTARLIDLEADQSSENLAEKLISFNIYSIENETETFTGRSYTKKTDSNGQASISLNLDVGNYIVYINFHGDMEYASCETSVKVNVNGTQEITKTTINQMKKVKRYYTKYGVSPNEKLLCSIGKKDTGSAYYVTIFERKCPMCGSKQLYWSIFWAGNETKERGVFPVIHKNVKGSNRGRIYCRKCEHGWNAIGESIGSGKNLKVHKKTSKSTKAKAYVLKNGKRFFDTVLKSVKTEKLTGNSGVGISRDENNTGSNYSTLLHDTIIKTAKNVVGNSTGIPAAKKIAKWMGKNIKHEKRKGLYQKPITTLKRKRGNCISQTDLFLQMCDATGVTRKYDCHYIHVGTEEYGKRHFFARVNGVDVDVDVKKKNPWGHASYNHRTVNKRTLYPELPINKNYKE